MPGRHIPTALASEPPAPEARSERPCPVCGGGPARILLELEGVPVHVGVLWPTRDAAVGCARGDIVLGSCDGCGFVRNLAFDPALGGYDQAYDNSLHHSPVFRATDDWLAARLIARSGLSGGEVLEIGCGGGHFLGLVCARSESHGTGFDPSHDPTHADPLLAGRAEVNRGFFDAGAASTADLVICRQVLEHVPDPVAFLAGIRAGLARRPDALVHIDVPDGGLALRKLSLGDILYEHCSYFLPATLEGALTAAGFEVTDAFRLFEGQFLGIEARVGHGGARPAPTGGLEGPMAEAVRTFPARFAERRAHWRGRLDALAARGARAVVWGAGARAVGFFNYLGVGEEVPVVVDVNPRKHGAFLAGTGQRIVAPEELVAHRPEVVILMNAVYTAEVAATLRALGVDAAIETVLA